MFFSHTFSAWLPSLLALLLASVAAGQDAHRVVIYYQTFFLSTTKDVHVTMLPLIEDPNNIPVTHVLVSSIHIVDELNGIQLNDFAPENPYFDNLWIEVGQLQAAGVKVMAMVGGAAPGSWERLDGDDESFEKYYGPLRDFLGEYNMQGIDLDVEQTFSIEGAVRLINRLRTDFGDDFIISLAPVASALTTTGPNLSGFNYFDLEEQVGDKIDFYNGQFYNHFADYDNTDDYRDILTDGFPAEKVVLGTLTSDANGYGFQPVLGKAKATIQELASTVPNFGGVAGWEYFNSAPGGTEAPWEWAQSVSSFMTSASASDFTAASAAAKNATAAGEDETVQEWLHEPHYLATRPERDQARIDYGIWYGEHIGYD